MAKKKHKQDKSVEIVRWSILGTVGLVITSFLIYAVLYTLGVFDSTTEKYFTLADREAQTDHIEVVEFFSYECIHCQRLERRIQQFESELPENVSFSRIHVSFNVQVRRLAKLHVALQLGGALDQNHDRIFQEAEKDNNALGSLDSISSFVDGYGISKAQFENLYQGRRVQALVDRNVSKTADARIGGTPSLLVANKYVVRPNEPRIMMQTLQQLIKDIRAGKLPLPEEELATETEAEQSEQDAPVEDESVSNESEVAPEQSSAETEVDSAENSPEESDSTE